MRLIHTADWHLGRVLCGVSLLDEQAHALRQLVSMVSDFRAKVVLISGDIYDRVVPTPEAVALLDEILSVLIKEVKVQVIFIDGFQDSPERLAFAGRLLEGQGLHARTTLHGSVAVDLQDEHGPVRVFTVPCSDLRTLKTFLKRPDLTHRSEASRLVIERLKRALTRGTRSVLMAHIPVQGGQLSGSEPFIPPQAWVPPELLEGFDLAALGYFHQPQTVETRKIVYAGSLLPYSFEEAGQARSVGMIQLDTMGRVRLETAAITPRKQIRRLEGKFQDLLRNPPDIPPQDFLQIRLTDNQPVLDAYTRLHETFPNLISLEHPRMRAAGPAQELDGPERLFEAFARDVLGHELSEPEREALREAR